MALDRDPRFLPIFTTGFLSLPALCPIVGPSLPITAMTEYDFSPAAYERFIKTQERVSNWVNESSGQSEHFVNPFKPTPATTKQPLQERSSRKQTKSPTRSRSSTPSAPSSSTTKPKPASQPPVRSRSMDDPSSGRPRKPDRSQTTPHTRERTSHHTASQDRYKNDRHKKRQNTRAHKSDSSHQRSHRHSRSNSTSQAYGRHTDGRIHSQSHNNIAYLPPPPPGQQQYLIFTPLGAKYQVLVCSPIRLVFHNPSLTYCLLGSA